MPGVLGVPVPANITRGSTGSMARLQTIEPFIGVSSRSRVIRAIEPQIGPRVDRLGTLRVGEQAFDDCVRMHTEAHAGSGPARAVVAAHHDALADRSYQDGALCGHAPPPDADVRQ